MDVYPGVIKTEGKDLYDATGLTLHEYPCMDENYCKEVHQNALETALTVLQYNCSQPVSIVDSKLSSNRDDKATVVVSNPKYVMLQHAIEASESRKGETVTPLDNTQYQKLKTTPDNPMQLVKRQTCTEKLFWKDFPAPIQPTATAGDCELVPKSVYRKHYPFCVRNSSTNCYGVGIYEWKNIVKSLVPQKIDTVERFMSACVLRGIDLSSKDVSAIYLVYTEAVCQMNHCSYFNMKRTDGKYYNKAGPILLPNFMYNESQFDTYIGCEKIILACRLLASHLLNATDPVSHDYVCGNDEELTTSEKLCFQFPCTLCSLILRNTFLSSSASMIDVLTLEKIKKDNKSPACNSPKTSFIPPETINITGAPTYFANPVMNLSYVDRYTHWLTRDMYAVNVLEDMYVIDGNNGDLLPVTLK